VSFCNHNSNQTLDSNNDPCQTNQCCFFDNLIVLLSHLLLAELRPQLGPVSESESVSLELELPELLLSELNPVGLARSTLSAILATSGLARCITRDGELTITIYENSC